MTDAEIREKAITFAKENKKRLALLYANIKKFPSEPHPISVFMAGSPGAGKTESARELIGKFSNDSSILRIDSDELRCDFENYNGTNSSLFQAATSIVVEKIHDVALDQQQSFVFDGTLSNYDKNVENIERSLKKSREVYIVYVYQDPIQAWEFVKLRAAKDGRVVPKEAFISQYFAAHSNVDKIKKVFGPSVRVDLMVKNIDGTNLKYKENIAVIDRHIKEKYSVETLNSVLRE